MLRSQPVDTWADGIAALDTPDYMLTFSGLVCTLLTLQLSTEQVDTIVPPLMDAFNLPDDARAFIFDHYLPEVGVTFHHGSMIRPQNISYKYKKIIYCLLICRFALQRPTPALVS